MPPEARAILDLGCSTGALGAALKARQGATVVGVELGEDYAREAEGRLDRVIVADAEAFAAGPAPPEAPFDCLIAADVLEHLATRGRRCAARWGCWRRAATAVVSLPNVLFWAGLLRVVRTRRWPREDEGLFDRTHLRWFGEADAVELLEQAGLREVPCIRATGSRAPRFAGGSWLARTPLRPYLAPQLVLTAVKGEEGDGCHRLDRQPREPRFGPRVARCAVRGGRGRERGCR